MNQTLKRLPETQMKIFFLIYVVFAAATFYFSPLLSILEALVILLLLTYYLITKRRRQQKVTRFIAALNHNIDSAGKDTMMNSPFPMVIFRARERGGHLEQRPVSLHLRGAGAPL